MQSQNLIGILCHDVSHREYIKDLLHEHYPDQFTFKDYHVKDYYGNDLRLQQVAEQILADKPGHLIGSGVLQGTFDYISNKIIIIKTVCILVLPRLNEYATRPAEHIRIIPDVSKILNHVN
jgi:hypothetical protein